MVARHAVLAGCQRQAASIAYRAALSAVAHVGCGSRYCHSLVVIRPACPEPGGLWLLPYGFSGEGHVKPELHGKPPFESAEIGVCPNYKRRLS